MKKKIYTLLLLLCVAAVVQAENRLVVATYNIRYDSSNDSIEGNGWRQRFPYIASQILFQGFDIFGTQEGLHHQLEQLKQSLPGYDYIGVGRDDGKQAGEYAAIFYSTEKFEVMEQGNFWLSTTPDQPLKGWDAVLPRICTWGKFRQKATGFTFLHFNLHMDHVGVQARAESAKLILAKIKALPNRLPVILTGDFNVDQHNESYTLLETSDVLRDAYTTAIVRYAPNGTFNNFSTDSKSDSRIDHIFLTNDFKVLRYGILTDTYRADKPNAKQSHARVLSDHFPVVIVVETKK